MKAILDNFEQGIKDGMSKAKKKDDSCYPCPVWEAMRSELENVIRYLESSPHLTFDRNNVKAFAQTLLNTMEKAKEEQ